MKRFYEARLVSTIVLCWAAGMGGTVWAQQTASPAEQDAPAAVAADNTQMEAAKKEVAAYQAEYEKICNEKGMVAALRFLLMPDYKQLDVSGTVVAHNRDEYIGMFADASPKEKAARQKYHPSQKPPKSSGAKGKYGVYKLKSSDVTAENYAVQNDTITVTQNSTVVLTVMETPGSVPHERRDVQILRAVYRRTPNGLRLQEDQTVSLRSFLDGKFESQMPVPRVGR